MLSPLIERVIAVHRELEREWDAQEDARDKDIIVDLARRIRKKQPPPPPAPVFLAPRNNTRVFRRALTRLTGTRGEQRNETVFYRLTVTIEGGQTVPVTVDVTPHRTVPAKDNINAIADAWRIDRNEIDTVLKDWTHEQLIEWLSQFTAEQLLPVVIRRQRGIR